MSTQSAETVRIVGTTSGDDALDVHLSDGAVVTLPWLWVRDHSHDAASYDHETAQRAVDTFSLADLRPAAVTHDEAGLSVDWRGEHPTSLIPTEVLTDLRSAAPAPRLWANGDEVRAEPVSWRDIESGDAVSAWLGDIRDFGLGLVRGVPGGKEPAQALAERIGPVRRTIFGDMWTLSTQVSDHADTAYGTETLEPHTDGCYSDDGPGLQLFVCQERSGDGGESVLVDGFAAADELRSIDREAFEILASTSVPSHYIEPGVEMRASRPTFRADERGALEQVTFNNYDRSPFLLAPEEMTRWYDAYAAFHALVSDRDRWWSHRLEPGDALIFDNWRCLHGRMAFTGTRVFEGCYLSHESLTSRLRTVGL